jgi:hypothetical protein
LGEYRPGILLSTIERTVVTSAEEKIKKITSYFQSISNISLSDLSVIDKIFYFMKNWRCAGKSVMSGNMDFGAISI